VWYWNQVLFWSWTSRSTPRLTALERVDARALRICPLYVLETVIVLAHTMVHVTLQKQIVTTMNTSPWSLSIPHLCLGSDDPPIDLGGSHPYIYISTWERINNESLAREETIEISRAWTWPSVWRYCGGGVWRLRCHECLNDNTCPAACGDRNSRRYGGIAIAGYLVLQAHQGIDMHLHWRSEENK
jgi:hypothetical protein